MSASNPCLTCGACCASLRVSFYWRETTEGNPDGVPAELTEPLNSFYSCMRGTNRKNPRCVALDGEVGSAVSCSIYAQRSSTCREFDILDEHGDINEACSRARVKHGLPPLTLLDLCLT